ncbi:MAG TPA: PEP-CTERM sorting domain-containing protein [Fimbriimonadaceae bacterium]|nr:PEP-CTERM sorting domain-containing protein [Fimbriimonadaceae bacterium]
MKASLCLFAGVALACVPVGAGAQSVLFDFNSGPQFTGTPLDQIVGGVRAHFDATGSGYSIQNTAQVIGMLPTGFTGLGLSPNSVFGSDLLISFKDAATSNPLFLSDVSIQVAPQELACDSSSTMRITAYSGASFVGTNLAVASGDVFTWPTIDLALASAQPFDNIVVHFESGPPTGGDWGGIFVADNLLATPVPEPAGLVGLGLGVLAALRLRRRRR